MDLNFNLNNLLRIIKMIRMYFYEIIFHTDDDNNDRIAVINYKKLSGFSIFSSN